MASACGRRHGSALTVGALAGLATVGALAAQAR